MKFKVGQRVRIIEKSRHDADHFIDNFVISQILETSSTRIFYSRAGLNRYYSEDSLTSYRLGKLKRILE